MIVPFTDRVSGTPVYINPDCVVALRPDPAALDRISIVKFRNRKEIRHSTISSHPLHPWRRYP